MTGLPSHDRMCAVTMPDELEPWQIEALNRYAQSVSGGDLFPEPVVDDEEPEEPGEHDGMG